MNINIRSSRNFGRFAKPGIKSTSRSVGYGLALLDEQAMWFLSAILHSRLTSRERAFLALAALWSLTDREYQLVIDHVEGS